MSDHRFIVHRSKAKSGVNGDPDTVDREAELLTSSDAILGLAGFVPLVAHQGVQNTDLDIDPLSPFDYAQDVFLEQFRRHINFQDADAGIRVSVSYLSTKH